jgi:hypothetical protein
MMSLILVFCILFNDIRTVNCFVSEKFHANRFCVSSIINPFHMKGLFAMDKKSMDKKKLETYIKVKRLKQMIADGKGYDDFIDEQRKYEKPSDEVLSKDKTDDDFVTGLGQQSPGAIAEVKSKLIAMGVDSDPTEVMKKVLKYQQEKIENEKIKQMQQSAITSPSVPIAAEITEEKEDNKNSS